MNFRKFFLTLFSIQIFLANPQIGLADEIILKNGDRLSGEILSLTKGVLKISTPYSKKIGLDKSQIKLLKTNHPVRVVLENGWKIKGRLTPTKEGLYSIKSAKSQHKAFISFDEISSINAPAKNPKAWNGKVYLGGSQQTGNTDRLTFSFGGEGELKLDMDRFELKFLTVYTEEDGKITSRNTYGRGQFDHFFNAKWYGLLSVEALNDKFKDLNLRMAVGPGLGYLVWDDDIKKLNFEAGITYFSEDLIDGADNQFMTGRLAGKFSYRFSDILSFKNETILFPSFESFGEYKLRNEAGINTRLGESWSLNLSHVLDYDNDAPSDVKQTDSNLILALQYDF